jgi:hypothetical protein
MKGKISLYLIFTLTMILAACLIVNVCLASGSQVVDNADKNATSGVVDSADADDAEWFFTTALPNISLVIGMKPTEDGNTDTELPDIGDDTDTELPDNGGDTNTELPGTDDDTVTDTPDIDDDTVIETPEVTGKGFTIDSFYTNSQANGGGVWLWMVNVSYNEMNASDLLSEKGLYLVFKLNGSDEEAKWYAFSYAFYLEEADGYNSTGYMNSSVSDVQFAVVNVKPDDESYGGYDAGTLTEENFIDITEVLYNEYYTFTDTDDAPEAGAPEVTEQGFLIDSFYTNSQANGGGVWLWMVNVSYNEMNASDLLSEKGLYLVFKLNGSDEEAKWYAFSYAFYLEEADGYNSTGYMNSSVSDVQFAVVNVKPDDEIYGGYDADTLTEENFVDASEVFYNQHLTFVN